MPLTIQDLGALGEFLGSIAVLVTLIYLALQTRQNTKALGAQADAARIGALLTLNLGAATSVELQEALHEDQIDAPAINEMRRRSWWSAALLIVQWQFHQAQRGLLPGFNEAGVVDALRTVFTTSRGFAGWWEGARSIFTKDFVEWVEEQRTKAA